jgi:hypothetical protein
MDNSRCVFWTLFTGFQVCFVAVATVYVRIYIMFAFVVACFVWILWSILKKLEHIFFNLLKPSGNYMYYLL